MRYLEGIAATITDPVVRARALHVTEENRRVLAFVEALRAGDLRAAGDEITAAGRRNEGRVHGGVVPNVALNGKFLFSIRPYRQRA